MKPQSEVNALASQIDQLIKGQQEMFSLTRQALEAKTKEELISTILALTTIIFVDNRSYGGK